HLDVNMTAFVKDCLAVHCHAILQLPTEIDSPSTASYYVNWLEHTLGYTPSYFELGNEPTQWTHFGCAWSTWATTCVSGSNATPTTYPPVVAAYVKAIRSVDSTTPIIGLGGDGQTIDVADGGKLYSGYDWAYDLYKAVGNSIQGISVHDYPGRYTTATSVSDFYSTLTTGDTLLPNMVEAQKGIAAGCANCTNAQILVTESNVYSCGACNQVYRNSFADVLAMGVDITEAISDGAVNIDLESLYNGAHAGDWFGPLTPEPVYYLYSDILARMPLTNASADWMKVTSSTMPGMFWLSSTYAAPNHWTLLALDLNTSAGATLQVPGSGFPTSGQFTFYRWNGSTTEPVSTSASSFTNATVGPQSLLLVVATTSSASTPVLPPAPTGLSSGAATSTSLAWSWTQSSGTGIQNDTVYLYTGPSCTGTSVALSTGGAATRLATGSLLGASTYSARVSAWNASGESPASGCASGTTLANPPSEFQLSGLVTALVGGQALSGATVSIPGVPSTTTNGSGAYRVMLSNGSYSVTVGVSGMQSTSASVTVSGKALSQNFALSPYDWVVSGAVTDSRTGMSLRGANVTILPSATGPSSTYRTGSTGQYTFDLPNGTYALSVSAKGYASASTGLVVAGAPSGHNFALNATTPRHRVAGAVVFANNGTRAGGVTVDASPAGEVVTNASGGFFFDLSNGSYSLTANLSGWISSVVAIVVQGHDQVVNLALTPLPRSYSAHTEPAALLPWFWLVVFGLSFVVAGAGLLALRGRRPGQGRVASPVRGEFTRGPSAPRFRSLP
ncbi:MAG TPA: carboxypeptidase regulatory-like domain-containing protein, partial [Thermoplasmata archaeon]|nr:carboxypeptidase regulatory-like domain-containing protein [Thermoplasmata archaeon]